MTYNVVGSIAKIDGNSGIYDGKIKNSSVRYGRNAINNHIGYLNSYVPGKVDLPNLKDLHTLPKDEFNKKMVELEESLNRLDDTINNLPPLDFELRYAQNKNGLDKLSVVGAAYEELGQRQEVTVRELSDNLKEGLGENFTAEAMDLNKDGKINLGEYSASIVLSDILSEKSDNITIKDANGIITNDGQKRMLPYGLDKNIKMASKIYQAIYDCYDLDNAQEKFLSDDNNLIK